MREELCVCILGLALAIAAQAAAAEGAASPPPVIVVVGHGTASRPPDFATVSLSARGEGKTSVESLQAMTARRTRIEAGLTALAGVKSLKLTTGKLSVSEARDPACSADDESKVRLSRGACAVSGYVAEMTLSANVSPAKSAGDVASLASELGGTAISLEDSGVQDPSSLQDQAATLAMRDARQQAETIAAASSLRLGPVLRIVDENASDERDEDKAVSTNLPAPEIAVTAQHRPAVSVGFDPPPTTRDAAFTVTYSVEP